MPDIHATAIIHPDAQIGEGVTIGPYCMVGPHVKLGAGSLLHAHAVVDGHTTIGRECQLFPFACIGKESPERMDAHGSTFAEIGDQTVLREFSSICTGAADGEVTKVGRKCLIMAYCHVAHGCALGNEIIMSNCAQLAGGVTVEDCAIIGGVSGVHQVCRIGTLAMIGSSSHVLQDCPPYMIMDGYVATVVGPNTIGLQRRGYSPEVRSAIKAAHHLIYREGLTCAAALERIRQEVPDLPEIRHLVEFLQQQKAGMTSAQPAIQDGL